VEQESSKESDAKVGRLTGRLSSRLQEWKDNGLRDVKKLERR
jgi:hypothetical protein